MTSKHLSCSEAKSATDIFSWIRHLADELAFQRQFKTAQSYRNCARSFSLFYRESSLGIEQLTPSLILDYQHFLLSKRNCLNTVSFYMRILRASYNKAVKAGLAEERNLFKDVYTGIAKTKKRAIDSTLIRRIRQLDLRGDRRLAFSRDLFLLSFYFRGMAFVDLANLKKADVQNGFICYARSKTKQDLRVKIEFCARMILDRWQCSCSDYLLPILRASESPQTTYESALRLHNKRLSKLSQMLNLEHALSSYVARHSWATLAKRSGVGLGIISESLGHNSLITTQIYLDSLDQDRIDDANLLVISKICA